MGGGHPAVPRHTDTLWPTEAPPRAHVLAFCPFAKLFVLPPAIKSCWSMQYFPVRSRDYVRRWKQIRHTPIFSNFFHSFSKTPEFVLFSVPVHLPQSHDFRLTLLPLPLYCKCSNLNPRSLSFDGALRGRRLVVLASAYAPQPRLFLVSFLWSIILENLLIIWVKSFYSCRSWISLKFFCQIGNCSVHKSGFIF